MVLNDFFELLGIAGKLGGTFPGGQGIIVCGGKGSDGILDVFLTVVVAVIIGRQGLYGTPERTGILVSQFRFGQLGASGFLIGTGVGAIKTIQIKICT